MNAVHATTSPAGANLGPVPSARSHDAMLAAFRPSGGMARGDDLGRLLDYLNRGDFVSLARSIASGAVFGFAWRGTFWIPMFQFELRDLSIHTAPQAVVAELAGSYTGWSLASWFCAPNTWLDDARPVDLLRTDLPAVLAAARADRFVVNG